MIEPTDIVEDFRLTPKERRSTIILISIIIMLISAYTIMDYFYHPKIELSPNHINYIEEIVENKVNEENIATEKNYKLEKFDPNTISLENLLYMGIDPYPAKSMINYRSKGGIFKNKSDLKKIYGVDATLFNKLSPYITISPKRIERPTSNKLNNQEKKSFVLRVFDPNKVTYEELQTMGLPKYFAQNLTNYVAKGGIIRRTEELKKIYGLSDTLYSQLIPYIQIDQDTFTNELINNVKIEDSLYTLNINSANIEELIKLKGIGPKRAELITKYRNNLGGFYDINQLKEVWSIDQEVFDQFSGMIYVDSTYRIMKIKEMSFKEILSHKYFDYQTTKLIKNYFDKHDQKSQLDDFIRLTPIDSTQLNRIIPYLKMKASM